MKENSKFIRPAGAFPQTPEGWRKYQNQFKMIDDVYKKWEQEERKTKNEAKRNRS